MDLQTCGLSAASAEAAAGATLQQVVAGNFSIAACSGTSQATTQEQQCIFNSTCTDVTAAYGQVALGVHTNQQFWMTAEQGLSTDLQTCGLSPASAEATVGATFQQVLAGTFSIAACSGANPASAQEQQCIFNSTCTDMTAAFGQIVGGTHANQQFWMSVGQGLFTDLQTCGLSAAGAEATVGATLQQVVAGTFSIAACTDAGTSFRKRSPSTRGIRR